MATSVETVQAEFVSLLGAARVVSDEATCISFAVDGKTPRCVVYPASAEQVAAVLRSAAERGLAVIPCRNGTKLSIGNPPSRYDLALSLKDLNNVWQYEAADLTVSVESGMKFGDFQHFVGRNGLWLPLDPAGGPRASLGGILATNAAGPLRLSYGAPRDMVLGMKIATTEGKVIKTGGRVVKNVAGYDIAKLLVGSYGSLGVIVEASLKLYPLPSERATFAFSIGTLDRAREFRRRILASPLTPLRIVLQDAAARTLTGEGLQAETESQVWELWIEAGGSARVIERHARELKELGQTLGAPIRRLEPKTAEVGWTRISDFRTWLGGVYPGMVVVKATLTIAAGEEFLQYAREEAENAKVRLASFSQPGAGVVHLALLEGMDTADLPALIGRLRNAAARSGGALLVERCPSDLKARVETWGSPGDDFEIMRKVKATWDPKRILSPGRFLGGL